MTTEQITWHNEATAILVSVTEGAPAAFTPVEISLTVGRTVPDGDKVKRPAWRIMATMGGADFIAPNALKAVNEAVKAKFGGTKFHDCAGAVADFKLPAMGGEDEKAEKPEIAWTEYENAAELVAERDNASANATKFFSGESDMRAGLKGLGQSIAAVAASLEKPKAFAAWLASGSADLQKALQNKNSKAELIFVGKLPDAWFDKNPETSNSAKAYQRNFNIDKNELAEDAAALAWGKKKNAPKAAQAQKALLESLADVAEADTRNGTLAACFLAALNADSDNGSVMLIEDGEDGLQPCKDGAGNYVSPILFGTGNRPNELIAAFCKAFAAAAPEARAEAEEKEADSKAAAAVKPRVFAEYGVSQAAVHLCRILAAREDWQDVFAAMDGMAERAETETWAQVLADVQNGIDEEAAKEAAAQAETDADDDA